MAQHALYVVSYLGRDRFVWAENAAEAREKVALPRTLRPANPPYRRELPIVGVRSAAGERQAWQESAH